MGTQNTQNKHRTHKEHAILGPRERNSSQGSSGFLKAPKNMTIKHKKHNFGDKSFSKNTP